MDLLLGSLMELAENANSLLLFQIDGLDFCLAFETRGASCGFTLLKLSLLTCLLFGAHNLLWIYFVQASIADLVKWYIFIF